MIMKKRVVPWALSLMMVLTLIPSLSMAVYAEDSDGSPAISIGAGKIEKGNKVYMGVRKIDGNIIPISWLVLGGANSTNLKNGDVSVDAENARLLITEKTQDVVQFDSDGQTNIWQGSNAQSWCDSFLTKREGSNYSGFIDFFTDIEETLPLATSKTDSIFVDIPNSCEWGESSLVNEKLFFLSAEEVSDDYGYFNGDESRIALKHDKKENDVDSKCDWWLRSPYSYDSSEAACVTPDGHVIEFDVYNKYYARPAFNINLNSVLFTSAAVGGKSSGANALSAISDNNTNEWKMTLYDSGRDSFEAEAANGAVLSQNQGYTSWLIPVTYSGARSGEKEYVSAILCDESGTAICYGNIASIADSNNVSGTVDVKIPTGLNAGNYKLHIFNEQINEDKHSDYASSFRTIDLKVNSYPLGGDTTKANPLKIKGKTATVKYRKLKKKAQTLKASKIIKTIKKGKGKLAYKLVSAKKGNKSFRKYFAINKTTGKVTVKKGLRKGKYKVKVKVKAAGNARYKASAWQAVNSKIRVR